MSIINFISKRFYYQRPLATQHGFLCIELLQGLLLLGVLLLLVSAYLVLSVHWQHQAIKRFEALNLAASNLAGASDTLRQEQKGIIVSEQRRSIMVPELAQLTGAPITITQKQVAARWFDERGRSQSITLVTS